ncbi:MAG: UDP-N-acetylglucosamine 2-epimerase [Deltaproteobacteria bacterium]|nr:UDP-N-acetylglucosamine 2-epimerase [Deltaproteobacteria bacterium]
MRAAAIHVVIGTKAQTIKMAPVVLALIERGMRVRLVDTGQHGDVTGGLRDAFGIPQPDVRLAPARNVSKMAAGLGWSIRLASLAVQRHRLCTEVFGGLGGVALLHGDNASTALGLLLARRAGMTAALVEAGLRSWSFAHPFPEEILRASLPRFCGLLYPPSLAAADNLRAMKTPGRIVETGANTVVDAMSRFLDFTALPETQDYGLWNCHRIENLFHPARLDRICSLALRAAESAPLRFVVDLPTRPRLRASGWWDRLTAAGVEFVDLAPYPDFLRLLAGCRYAATDGGSIQEECAVLGIPCLLLRRHTERSDGLGANAIMLDGLSRPEDFFTRCERFRRPPSKPLHSPSAQIAKDLQGILPEAS